MNGGGGIKLAGWVWSAIKTKLAKGGKTHSENLWLCTPCSILELNLP